MIVRIFLYVFRFFLTLFRSRESKVFAFSGTRWKKTFARIVIVAAHSMKGHAARRFVGTKYADLVLDYRAQSRTS